MLKHSRQREAIKEYLISTNSHPTADQIYQHVRETFPNISLGTVYRNLSLLTALGEIQKLSLGDDMDHFDADITPHCHIRCTCCNKVEDIDCSLPDTLDSSARKCYDGQILGHSVQFFGLCRECAKKQKADLKSGSAANF